MSRVKELIRKTLRSMGVEIIRKRPFGIDDCRDIATLYQGRKMDTIFDVGANEGQSAEHYARRFPNSRIFSFEPFPAAFAKLKGKENKIQGLTAVPCALGRAAGTQTLFLTEFSCTNSLLPTSAEAATHLGDAVKPAGQTTIPVRTLDDFCVEHQIGRIDLLKLDTQGYELNVLAGGTRMLEEKRIPLIYTELNFVPLYKEQADFHETYRTLKDLGYRLVGFYGVQYRSGPFISWCDGLFVNLEALEERT